MVERKLLLLVLAALLYGAYCVNMWFVTRNATSAEDAKAVKFAPEITSNKKRATAAKTKTVPLFLKDACSVLQVFTERPRRKQKKLDREDMETDNSTITAIGITTFLIILLWNDINDLLKAKEKERAKMKLNPDGGRRHSLAEFANKKTLRRESTKFSLQLFQIAETPPQDAIKTEKPRKTYARGDSINSYLSDNMATESSSPASVIDSSATDSKLTKRQSASKLFGARPVPMVRRSSFPALPLNPEVQALMLASRQSSFDSADEDGKGRRVRLIRRF